MADKCFGPPTILHTVKKFSAIGGTLCTYTKYKHSRTRQGVMRREGRGEKEITHRSRRAYIVGNNSNCKFILLRAWGRQKRCAPNGVHLANYACVCVSRRKPASLLHSARTHNNAISTDACLHCIYTKVFLSSFIFYLVMTKHN
jgi:hypothetical protein